MNKYKFSIIAILLVTCTSCEKQLQERVFSQLSPNNYFTRAVDAETALNAVYASLNYPNQIRDILVFGEVPTDIMFERAGAIFAQIQPVEDFTWDASHAWLLNYWTTLYKGIYDANLILESVPGIDMNEERKEILLGEARFFRAWNYFVLYDLFGPTPIVTTSETSVTDRPSRPSKEEFLSFVESEFTLAAAALPVTQAQYPRATKGAALSFLCKFYLNNKKWTEAAETAQQVIDLGAYSLFRVNNRTDLFSFSYEKNSELIMVSPYLSIVGFGNGYFAHAAPAGYKHQFGSKVIFAANFRIRSAFLNSFHPDDERLDAFITSYLHQNGNTVTLGVDDARSFKYPEDPNGVGSEAGNDIPLVRYADILLARAEALNELNGPTQESLDLINQVRQMAVVPDLQLADIAGKDDLRDRILDERGWEFHTEGLRRQDLIRHGKFIDNALSRGKTAAKPHHVLYPIPQREIDANPNLEQNEGY